MGLLGGLFGKKKEEEHPPLDASSEAAKDIETVKEQLASLAAEVPDRIEVMPAEGAAYVFIGNPPKKFGIAWIADGELHNFKTLLAGRGASPITVERLSNQLRELYAETEGKPRFSYMLGERQIVITPSRDLSGKIGQLIAAVSGK